MKSSSKSKNDQNDPEISEIQDGGNPASLEQDGASDELSWVDTDDGGIEQSAQAKLKKLREELKKTQHERDDYLAQLQRERADSINIRKSEEEKRASLRNHIIQNIVTDVLPALDSFDSAMKNKQVWESVDKNWRIGVEYIYSQLMKFLDDYDVKPINALHQEYNHDLHEAHEYRDTDTAMSGKVIEVLQKGYKLKESVLRPARVIVGK